MTCVALYASVSSLEVISNIVFAWQLKLNYLLRFVGFRNTVNSRYTDTRFSDILDIAIVFDQILLVPYKLPPFYRMLLKWAIEA